MYVFSIWKFVKSHGKVSENCPIFFCGNPDTPVGSTRSCRPYRCILAIHYGQFMVVVEHENASDGGTLIAYYSSVKRCAPGELFILQVINSKWHTVASWGERPIAQRIQITWSAPEVSAGVAIARHCPHIFRAWAALAWHVYLTCEMVSWCNCGNLFPVEFFTSGAWASVGRGGGGGVMVGGLRKRFIHSRQQICWFGVADTMFNIKLFIWFIFYLFDIPVEKFLVGGNRSRRPLLGLSPIDAANVS